MRILATVLLVGLMVGLRFHALRSDPYPGLDWSTGLLTDEGYYVHNARNQALFGHPRTDEFNNALLSPLLHLAQTALFTTLGTGSLQARLLSVFASLLTLPLLFLALRRAFDRAVAWSAVVFLGLDHTSLLYHRMALMDTPASLLAVGGLYAFVRGMEREGRERSVWLGLCGALVGLTVVTRALCVYLLPVPFLALLGGRLFRRSGAQEWKEGPQSHRVWKDGLAVGMGLALVGLLYLLLWYRPHQAEIQAMTHYYRTKQIQPESWARLRINLHHAFLGDMFGIFPYLFRHTPVLFLLALLGLLVGRAHSGVHPLTSRTETYLRAWLLLSWLLLAFINYSPSRYYITTYPALCALAASTLFRLPEVWERLRASDLRARLLRVLLVWWVVYHLLEWVLHRGGVLPPTPTMILLYVLPTLMALFGSRLSFLARWLPAPSIPLALALWMGVNGWWLGDWLRGLRWTQHEMSRWLGANLPAGSVLLGDVAPGVCLDNRFVAVNVIPGLCNGQQPVERFAGRPRYVVILDGPWKERYWLQNYPELVAPERRLRLVRLLKWDVGVYAVDPPSSADSRRAAIGGFDASRVPQYTNRHEGGDGNEAVVCSVDRAAGPGERGAARGDLGGGSEPGGRRVRGGAGEGAAGVRHLQLLQGHQRGELRGAEVRPTGHGHEQYRLLQPHLTRSQRRRSGDSVRSGGRNQFL